MFVVSLDLYSFYDSANNYWDFDRSDNIVDNVTSRKSIAQGMVTTTRSPAGTGLFVKKGTKICLNKYNMAGIESDDISIACLDPTTCAEGFTISVLIKVTGTQEALKTNIFLFGNRISEEHKGWSVGVLDNKLQIVVATDEDVCSLIDVDVMALEAYKLLACRNLCTITLLLLCPDTGPAVRILGNIRALQKY